MQKDFMDSIHLLFVSQSKLTTDQTSCAMLEQTNASLFGAKKSFVGDFFFFFPLSFLHLFFSFLFLLSRFGN